MAVGNICQHQFVASYKPDQAANARAETPLPGKLITAPINFTVVGADDFALNTSPTPKFCMVGAVSGTLYVRSGLENGVIAAGEGVWIPEGVVRDVHIEEGHTHLLFFGV